MKTSLLKRLTDYIQKDTGGKNESPKLIFVIRIMLLTMLFYIIINSIIYIPVLNNIGISILAISFLLFLALFLMSYHRKTFFIVIAMNTAMLIYIAASVIYFGWNIGVQHFILVLLVLSFFSGYSRYYIKFIYAALLCAFRIGLFFYIKNVPAFVSLSANMIYTLQVLNSIFIFWSIAMIAYVFSKDSQNLEHKLVEYNTQLISQANTDALTGLYNRRKAKDYMADILCPSHPTFVSVCICDIDFFKKVNDTYGHDIGDVVLKQISQTMKESLNGKAFIARWGGEEFLLVFPDSNGDEARFLLGQLREDIKALTFTAGDTTFHISMTFGLAEYDFGADVETVIKEADEKLYLGKEHGRDQIVF